jgi:DHA1 family multidrug resistance protein-like MFS transporter
MTALRRAIVGMSALAVLSDAVLIAFYPQFFERRYGVTGAFHVGAYVAAISLAVMCALPAWARVARRVETMHLLLATQCAAGVLCLLAIGADTVAAFWSLSLAMFTCKSSYLLMYPYLLRLQSHDTHGHTIGLLSVVVYGVGIAGAVIGGWTLQHGGPAACLALMAAGDFAQMAVCGWLIRTGRVVRTVAGDAAEPPPPRAPGGRRQLLRLCLLVLLVDFSAHLVSPFFSVYWEQVSGSTSQVASGAVFAIPGAVALVALLVNRRLSARGGRVPDGLPLNLLLGTAGLVLQGAPDEGAILAGRVLYGWAVFQLIVRLELLMFRVSTPSRYAGDYAVFNFFQNLGVLLSSFAAGVLVQRFGIAPCFALAAGGLLLTLVLHRLPPRPDHAAAGTPETADPMEGTRHAV